MGNKNFIPHYWLVVNPEPEAEIIVAEMDEWMIAEEEPVIKIISQEESPVVKNLRPEKSPVIVKPDAGIAILSSAASVISHYGHTRNH